MTTALVATTPATTSATTSHPHAAAMPATASRSDALLASPWQQPLPLLGFWARALSAPLTEILSCYWGLPVQLRWVGISEKPLACWRFDDFFSSSLPLPTQATEAAHALGHDAHAVLDTPHDHLSRAVAIQARTSITGANAILTAALGDHPHAHPGGHPTPQADTHFTALEQAMLTRAHATVLDLVQHAGIFPSVVPVDPLTQLAPQRLHAVWMLSLKDTHTPLLPAPLVISLPSNAIDWPKLTQWARGQQTQHAIPHVAVDHLVQCRTSVTLQVGHTKLPIDELKHLADGDLVVLEASSPEHLMLMPPMPPSRHLTDGLPQTLGIPASLSPNQRSFSSQSEGGGSPFRVQFGTMPVILPPVFQTAFQHKPQDLHAMTTSPMHTASLPLWEHLLVDVTAEFEPTKMPLHHVKQMSEGLVVEVGDLVHNTVRLHVEGNTIALGELVIVGDKFGVMIRQVVGPDGQMQPASGVFEPQLSASAGAPTMSIAVAPPAAAPAPPREPAAPQPSPPAEAYQTEPVAVHEPAHESAPPPAETPPADAPNTEDGEDDDWLEDDEDDDW